MLTVGDAPGEERRVGDRRVGQLDLDEDGEAERATLVRGGSSWRTQHLDPGTLGDDGAEPMASLSAPLWAPWHRAHYGRPEPHARTSSEPATAGPPAGRPASGHFRPCRGGAPRRYLRGMTQLAATPLHAPTAGPLGPRPVGTVLHVVSQVVHAADTPVAVIVEGGHFDPRLGADSFAIASLNAALQLTEGLIHHYARRVRVVISLLVDDLGASCGPAACTLADAPAPVETGVLPDPLDARLRAHRLVRRDRVVVTTERNARNRGLAALRGWTAVPDLLHWHGAPGARRATFQADDGASIPLAEETGPGRWTARCPLIMAQHYADLRALAGRRYAPSWPTVVVDLSVGADQPKVTRGAELAVRRPHSAPDARPHAIVNLFEADATAGVAVFRREDYT